MPSKSNRARVVWTAGSQPPVARLANQRVGRAAIHRLEALPRPQNLKTVAEQLPASDWKN